jgi:hypothetical protein
MESKIAALEALKSTATSEIDPLEAIQHIATGMLLLSFEVGLVPNGHEKYRFIELISFNRFTWRLALQKIGPNTCAASRTLLDPSTYRT